MDLVQLGDLILERIAEYISEPENVCNFEVCCKIFQKLSAKGYQNLCRGFTDKKYLNNPNIYWKSRFLKFKQLTKIPADSQSCYSADVSGIFMENGYFSLSQIRAGICGAQLSRTITGQFELTSSSNQNIVLNLSIIEATEGRISWRSKGTSSTHNLENMKTNEELSFDSELSSINWNSMKVFDIKPLPAVMCGMG